MEKIELQPDDNWRWLASLIDGIHDPEINCDAPLWPLIDVDATWPQNTGKYLFKLNNGGLKYRGTTKVIKELFKEKILPYLIKSMGAESKKSVTCNLELHVAEGTIKRVILH